MLKKITIHLVTLLSMPFAWCWVKWHERRVLKHGSALTSSFVRFAEQIGIKDVDSVRVHLVEHIPTPVPQFLQRFYQKLGFPVGSAVGMCMGHGIYVMRKHAGDVELLAHELVHTQQYERLGGTWKFLRLYLFENLYFSYAKSPLEHEANSKADLFNLSSTPVSVKKGCEFI